MASRRQPNVHYVHYQARSVWRYFSRADAMLIFTRNFTVSRPTVLRVPISLLSLPPSVHVVTSAQASSDTVSTSSITFHSLNNTHHNIVYQQRAGKKNKEST